MKIQTFKNKIQAENVEGNLTYLSVKINGCKYGQSYQNQANTLEGMKNAFVLFYYPLACEDVKSLN